MRLIFHIGMPKTGTSTLQQALYSHSALLDSFGVLYPTPMFGQPNHNMIAALFHCPETMPREFTRGGAVPVETIWNDARIFWESVSEQVRGSDAQTVVLSGEYFFSLRRERMSELRTLVADLFDEVCVVAYVRHPADYYLAFVQQQVKASFAILSPAEMWIPLRRNIRNYLEAFEGSVVVRPYEREALDNESIVADFAGRFLPRGGELAEHINVVDLKESMSAETMCILQSFRRHVWPDENDLFAPESTDVLAALQGARDRIPQTRARLKPAIREALSHRNRRSLDWLKSTFDVAFVADTPTNSSTDTEPEGWRSTEVSDILEVDRGQVDCVMHLLLKELMTENAKRE